MTPKFLIDRFHLDAEACAAAFESEPAGRQVVADALFSVAVAHKMRAGGADAFRAELETLLATIEPIAEGEGHDDGPSLLH